MIRIKATTRFLSVTKDKNKILLYEMIDLLLDLSLTQSVFLRMLHLLQFCANYIIKNSSSIM